MGALEQFKLKMAEKRLFKELQPVLNEHSIKTAHDIGLVLNTVTRTATRTDLPDVFTTYCRKRYTALANGINYTIDDDIYTFNKPNKEQLANTPLSVKDLQTDTMTIIYEPKEKTIFIDAENQENNLRIQKYVGMFQFYDNNCKLHFFRMTEELDCRGQDEKANADAKVLNTIWTVEPFYFTMPANFLDLYLAGEDYQPEMTTVLETGIPPDEELLALLNKYLDILTCVIYSVKTNLNRYCRLTQTLILRNPMGKTVNLPVSVLQLMNEEIEGLNDNGRSVHKPKPVKAKTVRKPRVKPQKRK